MAKIEQRQEAKLTLQWPVQTMLENQESKNQCIIADARDGPVIEIEAVIKVRDELAKAHCFQNLKLAKHNFAH
ncbi:hypothetical protein P8452_36929 [Trifolium repens]|jgi:hypothetical protein|nr:hypothetical protein P8452_31513 [Trifolium repens]WJX50657.1 hypothetical protein P8452_36929 [Trifolium repens]